MRAHHSNIALGCQYTQIAFYSPTLNIVQLITIQWNNYCYKL